VATSFNLLSDPEAILTPLLRALHFNFGIENEEVSEGLTAPTSEEVEPCARAHANVYREDNILTKQYAEQKALPYVDLHGLTCNDSECPILDD